MVTAVPLTSVACQQSAALARAWAAAAGVLDPEVPVLTIADLGVLREVRIADGAVEAVITPTYLGCPAMAVIALDIETALAKAGFARCTVTTVLSPPWTTDFMSDAGRVKLLHEFQRIFDFRSQQIAVLKADLVGRALQMDKCPAIFLRRAERATHF